VREWKAEEAGGGRGWKPGRGEVCVMGLGGMDAPVRVGKSVVEPVSVVRDLGVMIDAVLTMREHVTRTKKEAE
jgi:hypothetical protein